MSLLIENEVCCPSCKFAMQAELWSSITVKDDPELKDLLLGGELNFVECQSCKLIFYVEQFLLYHDRDEELFAFVYPMGHQAEKEKWLKKTKTEFLKVRDNVGDLRVLYEPQSFFGLHDLIEQVKLEEERKIQSDIVAFLAGDMKLTLKKIKPSLARRQGIPAVLPLCSGPDKSFRQQLISGIEMIEKKNNLLFHYVDLKNKLIRENDWNLEIV